MLKIGSIRWKGRCSKHPRYNPEEDGEGGLVGGCGRCLQLLGIFVSHKKTLGLLKSFGPMREIKLKPKPKTLETPIDDRQTSLFQY